MKTALITGGTSGLGKAFAEALAKQGYKTIIVGRDDKRGSYFKQKLNKLYNNNCEYVKIDLIKKGDLLKLQEYIKTIDNLEIFVNGAGFLDANEFTEGDERSRENMILLHNLATTKLCYTVCNKMKSEKTKGKIINISSIAAFLKAGNPLYAGTKAFIRTFSLNLSEEMKQYGIYVQALCPGCVETNLWKKNLGKAPRLGKLPTEKVIKTSLRYCTKGKVQCIPGFINKLIVLGMKISPKSLTYKFSKGIIRF